MTEGNGMSNGNNSNGGNNGANVGTSRVKMGLAQMLKGGVIVRIVCLFLIFCLFHFSQCAKNQLVVVVVVVVVVFVFLKI